MLKYTFLSCYAYENTKLRVIHRMISKQDLKNNQSGMNIVLNVAQQVQVKIIQSRNKKHVAECV